MARPSGPWARRFEEPIPLPGGRHLVTLHEARAYVLALPPADQQDERWQAAAGELLKAAEHGGVFLTFARISMMQALIGRDPHERPPPGGRKCPEFRRRKLKRDM